MIHASRAISFSEWLLLVSENSARDLCLLVLILILSNKASGSLRRKSREKNAAAGPRLFQICEWTLIFDSRYALVALFPWSGAETFPQRSRRRRRFPAGSLPSYFPGAAGLGGGGGAEGAGGGARLGLWLESTGPFGALAPLMPCAGSAGVPAGAFPPAPCPPLMPWAGCPGFCTGKRVMGRRVF